MRLSLLFCRPWVWVLLTGAALLAGPVLANCENTAPYLATERILSQFLRSKRTISTQEQTELGRAVKRLKTAHSSIAWTPEDRQTLNPAVDAVLQGAADYQDFGITAERDRLNGSLQEMAGFLIERCNYTAEDTISLSPNIGDRDSPRENTVGAAGGEGNGTRGQGGGSGDGARSQAETAQQLAFGMGGLGALVGILFLGQRLVGWVYSYRFNRKSCRVRTEIWIGGTKFEGVVSVLGITGCRLDLAEDVDPAAFVRALTEHPAEVSFGDIWVPGFVLAIYDTEIGLVFDQPLALAWQLEILSTSTSAPYYVEAERKGANFDPVRFDPPQAAYRRALPETPLNAA